MVLAGLALYFEMIFLRAWPSTFHGNTLTSFSMFRGFGLGNAMMILKNSSDSALDLVTVKG